MKNKKMVVLAMAVCFIFTVFSSLSVAKPGNSPDNGIKKVRVMEKATGKKFGKYNFAEIKQLQAAKAAIQIKDPDFWYYHGVQYIDGEYKYLVNFEAQNVRGNITPYAKIYINGKKQSGKIFVQKVREGKSGTIINFYEMHGHLLMSGAGINDIKIRIYIAKKMYFEYQITVDVAPFEIWTNICSVNAGTMAEIQFTVVPTDIDIEAGEFVDVTINGDTYTCVVEDSYDKGLYNVFITMSLSEYKSNLMDKFSDTEIYFPRLNTGRTIENYYYEIWCHK